MKYLKYIINFKNHITRFLNIKLKYKQSLEKLNFFLTINIYDLDAYIEHKDFTAINQSINYQKNISKTYVGGSHIYALLLTS